MKEKHEARFISDIIGEEYKQWGTSDIIFITAPTGTGKTTFILQTYLKWIIKKTIDVEQGNAMYAFPKQMLYLVNRTILKKQLEKELEQIQFDLYSEFNERIINLKEFITIQTYQNIEEELLNQNTTKLLNKLNTYDCVVCDEAHYFYTDSNFNTNTEISFDCIRAAFDSKIQIYMSATLNNVRSIIETRSPVHTPYHKQRPNQANSKTRFKEYSVNGRYNIALQIPLKSLDELIRVISENQKEKWLIFVDSIEDGKEFQKQLNEQFKEGKENSKIKKEDIVFIDARYEQDETANYSVNEIVKNQYSKKKIIIATAVMDNGISLHDEDLRNIVILADTEEEFIQMLGRKRIDSSLLKVYILKRNKEYFQSRLNYQEQIYKNYRKIENYIKAMYRRRFDMEGLDATGDSKYMISASLENISPEDKKNKLSFLEAQDFLEANPEFMGHVVYGKDIWIEYEVTPYVDLVYRSLKDIDFGNNIKKSYVESVNYESILSNQQVILNILLSNRYGASGLKKVLYSVRGILAVNAFAIRRCLNLIRFYRDMIQRLETDDYAFVAEQASWIDQIDKIDQMKESEYEKNREAILERIKSLLNQKLSLKDNEWYFKHELLGEMLYILKKCNVPSEEIKDIKKRNRHRKETYEEWNKRVISQAIPLNPKYINIVLEKIGSEYRIKKEGRSYFVFTKDTALNK